MSITEYPFPDVPMVTGFCVFPGDLEDDELTLFHATPAKNLEAITTQGFRIPDPEGVCGLASVSFAKRSIMALTHAMVMRRAVPGDYCILVVRYETLCRNSLVINPEDIHDYTLDPGPEIVGFCTIPETYQHR